MSTSEQRVALRRLLDEATPGPWLDNEYYKVVQTGSGDLHAVVRYGNTPQPEADAALIVALRNHAEDLLDAADERDVLRAKLEQLHAFAADEMMSTDERIDCIVELWQP